VEGVKAIEGWGYVNSQLLSLDEKTSDSLDIIALPENDKLVKPVIVQGRWLLPGDENAIVIGNAVQKVRPDLKVGDIVTLKIDKYHYQFNIVGVFRRTGTWPVAYANNKYINQIVHQPNQFAILRLITSPQDVITQDRVRSDLDKAFTKEKIRVREMFTRYQEEASNQSSFDIIIAFLLIMALMIAIVGGLGLMGTMSMNVLERTREIGVMRATGASDAMVLGIVVTEGMIIGMISWLMGSILATPISIGLNNALGDAMFGGALSYHTSVLGYLLWLAVALGISALASAMPARNASRLTIREILAYE
jgi:putative ABC transport system permease protein